MNELISINALPPEMHAHILSFLEPENLGVTQRVCQDWNILSKRSMEEKFVWHVKKGVESLKDIHIVLKASCILLRMKKNEVSDEGLQKIKKYMGTDSKAYKEIATSLSQFLKNGLIHNVNDVLSSISIHELDMYDILEETITKLFNSNENDKINKILDDVTNDFTKNYLLFHLAKLHFTQGNNDNSIEIIKKISDTSCGVNRSVGIFLKDFVGKLLSKNNIAAAIELSEIQTFEQHTIRKMIIDKYLQEDNFEDAKSIAMKLDSRLYITELVFADIANKLGRV